MILVDGKAQLYRLLGGMRPNTRSEREAEDPPAGPVEPQPDASVVASLVEGFLFLLRNLLRLQPTTTHVAVAFDAAGLTFRHDLFPAYKAGRPPAAPEMEPAIRALQEVLPRVGVGVLRVPGVEAEDVLASLAARATAREGFTDVVIMSPDKDLYQLLGPHVRLLRALKAPTFPPGAPAPTPEQRRAALQEAAAWYTVTDFREEHPGLEPPQWVEVMALAGSASDNVPGVPGVGVKIAAQVIAEWGSLEELLPHASEVKRKKVAEVLATPEGAQAARFTRALVTIATDLAHPPVIQPLDDFQLRPVPEHDKEAVLQLAARLGVQAGVLQDIIAYPQRSAAPPRPIQPPHAAPPATTLPPVAGASSFPTAAPVRATPAPSVSQQPLRHTQGPPSPHPFPHQPQPGFSHWQSQLVASAAAVSPPMHSPYTPPPVPHIPYPPVPPHHPSARSPTGFSQRQPEQQQQQQQPQQGRQAPPQQHTRSAPNHQPALTTAAQLSPQQQAELRQQLATSSWKPLGYSPPTPNAPAASTPIPTSNPSPTPDPTSTPQTPSFPAQPLTRHPSSTPSPPPQQYQQQPPTSTADPSSAPASSPHPQGRPPPQPSLRPFQQPPFAQPPGYAQQPPFANPPPQPPAPSTRRSTAAPRLPAGPPPPRSHPMATPTRLGGPRRSSPRPQPSRTPTHTSASAHTGAPAPQWSPQQRPDWGGASTPQWGGNPSPQLAPGQHPSQPAPPAPQPAPAMATDAAAVQEPQG